MRNKSRVTEFTLGVFAIFGMLVAAVAILPSNTAHAFQRVFPGAFILNNQKLCVETSEGAGADLCFGRTSAGLWGFYNAQGTDAGKYALTTVNGAQIIYGANSELLTLNTGGVNSTTVGNLLPANSFIDTVVGNVTTTITGTCSGWTLADTTTAGRFAASNTTLTAGTTSVGSVHLTTGIASATTGAFQAAAAKVQVVCATGAASAGAIRITVFYHQFVAPTS